MLTRTLMLVLALTLSACASLGVPSPDTFNKRVAVAQTTVQTVAESATAAYTAGKLSETDRTNVVTTGRSTLAAIDVARNMHATNPTGAENKLASALAILVALQTYLASQGVK